MTQNSSGYEGISKDRNRWRFRVTTDGKIKTIKQSVNLEYLIEFADKWKLDNTHTTIRSSNISGYKGINKSMDKNSKQGFKWQFRITIDGERRCIKTSVDLDKLIKFADKWKIDNNYNT
jgi:hypothetical protein